MNPSRYQQALDHLAAQHCCICTNPKEQTIEFDLGLELGIAHFTLHFPESSLAQLIVAKFGVSAPPNVRPAAIEFANGFNGEESHTVLVVNREFGVIQLRFTHTHPVDQFFPELLDAAITYVCRSVRMLFPYLLRLVTGQVTPATALEQLEAEFEALHDSYTDSPPSD
jgi:hypothetical protein